MGTVPIKAFLRGQSPLTTVHGDCPQRLSQPVVTVIFIASPNPIHCPKGAAVMARQPRNKPHAEFHHITNRGACRRDIYRDTIDHEIFFDLIERAHVKFEFALHAFCLMGNHYHLLAQFPNRNMPQVMHWIGLCYSIAFNRKYGTDGRLCRDRYFSKPIEDEAYLLTVTRYIHQNPKAFGLDDFSEYDASSYQMYLGLKIRPDWMRTDLIEGFFADTPALRRYMDAIPNQSLELPARFVG